MASASPDNIKQWKFPDGNFIQNLSGHSSIVNALAVNQDGVLASGGEEEPLCHKSHQSGARTQSFCCFFVTPRSIETIVKASEVKKKDESLWILMGVGGGETLRLSNGAHGTSVIVTPEVKTLNVSSQP